VDTQVCLGDAGLSKGFSLVEVMVALFIMVLSLVALTRLYIASVDAEAYSEALTFADILAQEKLHSLMLLPVDSASLASAWYTDTNNPLRMNGKAFWRFWLVRDDKPGSKEISVYVCWNERKRHGARNFSSLGDLDSSTCPSIKIRGWVTR